MVVHFTLYFLFYIMFRNTTMKCLSILMFLFASRECRTESATNQRFLRSAYGPPEWSLHQKIANLDEKLHQLKHSMELIHHKLHDLKGTIAIVLVMILWWDYSFVFSCLSYLKLNFQTILVSQGTYIVKRNTFLKMIFIVNNCNWFYRSK